VLRHPVLDRYRSSMARRFDAADPMLGVDAAGMRRILVHEARVHALPGRELRDLDDSLLLYDAGDPEPFWNRLEGIRWPDDPAAFDRRLDEVLVLFATLGRRPHIWAAPGFDTPADLTERLLGAGFEDVGPGCVMLLVDPDLPAGRLQAAAEREPSDVEIHRWSRLEGAPAAEAAHEIVTVLLDAFGVDESRSGPIRSETIASLGHPWFTHYVIRWRGNPAAVARRATFDGLTYLSSVGTAPAARGRGFAGLVTAAAAHDAALAGSEFISLGVFAENDRAIRLYRRLGFEMLGSPAADLLLVG
jgi:GNAT superfamily N-acetyltransferase